MSWDSFLHEIEEDIRISCSKNISNFDEDTKLNFINLIQELDTYQVNKFEVFKNKINKQKKAIELMKESDLDWFKNNLKEYLSFRKNLLKDDLNA
jgi:hypothetical protein